MIKVPAIVEKMRGEPLGNPVKAQAPGKDAYVMRFLFYPVWRVTV